MYLIHSILIYTTRSIHPDLLISVTYSCSIKSTIYEALYYALFLTLLLEPSTYINISNQHYFATSGIVCKRH